MLGPVAARARPARECRFLIPCATRSATLHGISSHGIDLEISATGDTSSDDHPTHVDMGIASGHCVGPLEDVSVAPSPLRPAG
jgi:hypothetical protein